MASLAQVDYKPGDEIQTCEPLFKFVTAEQKGKVCTNCLKNSSQLKKCAKCGEVAYCDKNCQTEDWNFVHKTECKSQFFRGYCSVGANAFVKRLLFRMLAAFHQDPTLIDKPHQMLDGSDRTFKDLVSHAGKEHSMAVTIEMARMTSEMGEAERQQLGVSFGRILELFSIYETNAHQIYNAAESEVLGSGIYIQQSVYNHSCTPNALFCTYGGSSMTIRAVAQISKGEEICISYISRHAGKLERQKMLLERYHFDCRCKKCETESDSKVKYEKLNLLVEEMEMDKIWGRMPYGTALDKHNTIMRMYRQIYNEYDERVANQYIRLMSIIGMSPQLLRLPRKEYTQLMENEIGHHILTTFGPEKLEYKEYCTLLAKQAIARLEWENRLSERRKQKQQGGRANK